MIKFNLQVAAFRRKYLANHGVAEAVTLATLTAVIGYFNRFLRLDMTSSMAILFRECEGGGNVYNLCQYVSSETNTPVLNPFAQDRSTMAYIQLVAAGNNYSNWPRCGELWV